MELLINFVVLIAAIIAPVMFAARKVGARRTDFASVLPAAILLAALSLTLQHFGLSEGVGFLLLFIGGAVIFTFALGTRLTGGLLLSIVGVLAQLATLMLLAYLGLWTPLAD